MICVNNNTVVALRYIMYNKKGAVLENTMHAAPVNYVHGSKSISLLLQQQLHGLKPGDKKQIVLLKNNSEADDDFTFDVIIDNVREALDEEIMLGYPVQITTEICKVDCYCYT